MTSDPQKPNPYPCPELYKDNLTISFLNYGVEYKFTETISRHLTTYALPFLGVNDNKISDVCQYHKFENRLFDSPMKNLVFNVISTDLFVFLYKKNIEHLWIFSDYFAKRKDYPGENISKSPYENEELVIIELTSSYKIKTMELFEYRS